MERLKPYGMACVFHIWSVIFIGNGSQENKPKSPGETLPLLGNFSYKMNWWMCSYLVFS